MEQIMKIVENSHHTATKPFEKVFPLMEEQ